MVPRRPFHTLIYPQSCLLVLLDCQQPAPGLIFDPPTRVIVERLRLLTETAGRLSVPALRICLKSRCFSEELRLSEPPAHVLGKRVYRSQLNAWKDDRFVDCVEASGRRQLVLASPHPLAGLLFCGLCAVEEGYDTFFLPDLLGDGASPHIVCAVQRLLHAGATSMTTRQLLLEWHKDDESGHIEEFPELAGPD